MEIERNVPKMVGEIGKGTIIGQYEHSDHVFMVANAETGHCWYLVNLLNGQIDTYLTLQHLINCVNNDPDMYIMNAKLVEL